MPSWAYHCAGCKLTFELHQVSDVKKDVQCCPLCGRFAERQPAAPAVVIHGFSAKNGYSK